MDPKLEYEDIVLIPAPINKGIPNPINLFVTDTLDTTSIGSTSLPIFNAPMEGIIDENNWKLWADQGIKTILPRTVPLNIRVQACTTIWCAFSYQEAEMEFIKKDCRNVPSQLHVCLDCGNGHDFKVIELGNKLKQLYKGQMVLMGGNIGNPDTYQHYVRAGFNYVRVGIASGSIVDKDHFGFHYPMASLLIEIIKSKKMMTAQGLTTTKIIADGGIKSHSDILKSIALGADYVMLGKEFIQLFEAGGEIYKRGVDPSRPTKEYFDELTEEEYKTLTPDIIRKRKLYRNFHGNTSQEVQAIRAGFGSVGDWRKSKPGDKVKTGDSIWERVRITSTLDEWVREFKEKATYGFMMAGVNSWEGFAKDCKYVPI